MTCTRHFTSPTLLNLLLNLHSNPTLSLLKSLAAQRFLSIALYSAMCFSCFLRMVAESHMCETEVKSIERLQHKPRSQTSELRLGICFSLAGQPLVLFSCW